jgi:hypothetical protein
MFALDHALAQDIVDRAMAILPCNVNVMDYLGIIIGSGEAERLYTRHEGAQLVLANSRVVEIDSHTARQLDGVRPGVKTCCRGYCSATALPTWSLKLNSWVCSRSCRARRCCSNCPKARAMPLR